MNVDLLARVEAYIREHPERYDQGSWVSMGRDHAAEELLTARQMTETPLCDTTACVAGTAVLLSGKLESLRGKVVISEIAQEVLDLDQPTATWLFRPGRYEPSMPDVLACLREGGTLKDMEAVEDAAREAGG